MDIIKAGIGKGYTFRCDIINGVVTNGRHGWVFVRIRYFHSEEMVIIMNVPVMNSSIL